MATNYIAPTWRMPENTNKDKLSNYSLDLDGNSNYINFTETEFLNNGQASFSFWIKPESYGGNNYGYFFSGATSTQGGIAYSEGGSSGPYYPGVLYWYNGSVSTVLDVVVTENVWNHIVVVFDGTSLKTYKDGSLGTTKTITAATTLAFDTIGRYNNTTTHYINGSISEFSVFDYAVSQEQVTYLYNLNNPMAITGRKPIAYYPLGDNSNPRALAGYPNLAVKGNVFNFNGNTQAINCGSGSRFNIDKITISSWVKFNSVSPTLQIIGGIRNTSNGLIPYLLSAQNVTGTKLRFLINQSSDNTYKIIYSNDNIVTNTWYHVVGVADGSNIKMYVNGFLQADQTAYDGTITSPTQNFNIGRQPSNPLYHLSGQISNISVFNTGLSQLQVETIYNNGAPGDISSLSPLGWWKLNGVEDIFNGSSWTIKDYGSGSNNGTSVGSMTSANLVQSSLYSTTPYSNYSVSLNGGTEFIRTPTSYGSYLSGATSCSISVWAKLDNNTLQQPVVSTWDQPDTTKSYLIRYVNDSRRFQFYLWGPAGAGDSRFGLANTEKAISANRWYHIVGTWDGTTIKIYQDGVFEGSENAPGGALQTVNQQNFTGRYRTTYFQGDISNQAFWKNTVLTQDEITEIYNAGVSTDLNNFSGTAPNVWYPMDENSTYFPGANNPTELYIRDVMSDRYSSGYNMDTSNFVGNAPGSIANGTGNNLDISNLKGDMSNSIKNSYSINMADYGDPNGQGLTPANSGRTTDVPGSVDPGGQFSPFNTSTTPRGFEGDACEDSNDGQFYTEEFPPQPVIPSVGAIVYTDAAGTGYPEEGYYSQFIEEYNIKVYYEIGANGEVTNSDMCI